MDMPWNLKLREEDTFRLHMSLDEFRSRFDRLVDIKTTVFAGAFNDSPFKYFGRLNDGEFWVQHNFYYRDRDPLITAISHLSRTKGNIEDNGEGIVVTTTTKAPIIQTVFWFFMAALFAIFSVFSFPYGWLIAICIPTAVYVILSLITRHSNRKWREDFTSTFLNEKN
jgi:hypothetical protein